MNQTETLAPAIEKHAGKVVYFATGTLTEVAADLARLGLHGNGTRLRVVAPAGFAPQLAKLAAPRPGELVSYRLWTAPLVWLRLLVFLGLSRHAEVVCLTSPQRFRFLKLLALTLRGYVVFSPISGARIPLGFLDLGNIWLRQRWAVREQRRKHFPVGVIGSASGYYLSKIVPVLRARYPGAPIHGLLLSTATPSTAALFDSVHVLKPGLLGAFCETMRLIRAGKRYQRWVIPCTNEPYGWLKFMAFLWPVSRRQIYNELADGFAVRDLRTLWWHFRWRLRDRMSFQIVAASAGLRWPVRLAHLSLYGLRVLSALPLLWKIRLRSLRGRWPAVGFNAAAGGSERGETVWNAETESVNGRLAPSAAVAPRLPGERGGPVGVE